MEDLDPTKLSTEELKELREKLKKENKEMQNSLSEATEIAKKLLAIKEASEAKKNTSAEVVGDTTPEPTKETEQTQPVENEPVFLSDEEELRELLEEMPMDTMEENKQLYEYLLKESADFPDVIAFAKRQSEKIARIEELEAKLASTEVVEAPIEAQAEKPETIPAVVEENILETQPETVVTTPEQTETIEQTQSPEPVETTNITPEKPTNAEQIEDVREKINKTLGITTETGDKQTEGKKTFLTSMYNLRFKFRENEREIDKIIEKRKEISYEEDRTPFWKIKKRFQLSKEFKNLQKQLQLICLENEILKENFYKEDRENFPFPYYLVDKIKNEKVKNFFTNKALTVKKGEDRNYVSLYFFNSIYSNNKIDDPFYDREYFSYPGFKQYHMESNNILHYNICGFSLEPKNPKEITENNNGFDVIEAKLNNPNAKYRVLDPEGKILIDEANYSDALQIYREASIKYLDQMEENFKK